MDVSTVYSPNRVQTPSRLETRPEWLGDRPGSRGGARSAVDSARTILLVCAFPGNDTVLIEQSLLTGLAVWMGISALGIAIVAYRFRDSNRGNDGAGEWKSPVQSDEN